MSWNIDTLFPLISFTFVGWKTKMPFFCFDLMQRNYRTFFLFVSTSTILCIYVFTFSLLNLLNEPGHIWSSMSRDVLSVVLIVYCFICVWFVGGLSVFHFYLICTNQVSYLLWVTYRANYSMVIVSFCSEREISCKITELDSCCLWMQIWFLTRYYGGPWICP